MNFMITCIAMQVSVTTLNVSYQLVPHSLWMLLPLKSSRLEYKVCCSTPVCIALCHVRIIYVHSTSFEMSRTCIYLGMHDQFLSNGTCHESLDIAHQCVANEVINTPIAKNFAIIMAASKQFIADYLLKSLSNGE